MNFILSGFFLFVSFYPYFEVLRVLPIGKWVICLSVYIRKIISAKLIVEKWDWFVLLFVPFPFTVCFFPNIYGKLTLIHHRDGKYFTLLLFIFVHGIFCNIKYFYNKIYLFSLFLEFLSCLN